MSRYFSKKVALLFVAAIILLIILLFTAGFWATVVAAVVGWLGIEIGGNTIFAKMNREI